MRIRKATFILFIFAALFSVAHATVMDMVSDLISTSAPSMPADHQLQFTVASAIPPSGSFVVRWQPGAFTIPSSFDYTDVDLAVWDGSAYVDRSLAAAASVVDDGVAVVTGTSGIITLTLSSSQGILAGSKVQLRMGTNATFGSAGSVSIVNPTAQASYRIGLVTTSNTGVLIDYATAMIATVFPVTVNVPLQNVPPTILSSLPSGELAANSARIEFTLFTDRTASCRYSLTANTPYASMTNSFSPHLGTFFYTVVGGHVNGTAYTYYVRCMGVQGAVSDDYPLSFSIAATPISNTSVTQVGEVIGSGDVPNGSMVLYLAAATIAGFTAPGSTVRVLKDGVVAVNVQSGADGSFQADITGLERGTYTFTLYSIDKNQRKTVSYSSTLAVGAGTSNKITNVMLAPTMTLELEQIAVNGKVHASGEAAPNSLVELFLAPKSDITNETKRFTATTSASGLWDLTTAAVSTRGTYAVKARQLLKSAQSDFSATVFAGVGEAPSGNTCARSDINGDGKVNLIDFSILLTGWGTSEAKADLNCDGKVNLADFSILLFNWTG